MTPVGGSYYAHIGPGLADRVDTLLPTLPEVERGVIIEASEDTAVAARVAERFAATGIATHRVAMPDTQAAKTFGAAEYLATVFADHALHKDDLVIAVGGEAICDIAGFVTSTFNRGMKLCLIPTANRVLEQLDASFRPVGRSWRMDSRARTAV